MQNNKEEKASLNSTMGRMVQDAMDQEKLETTGPANRESVDDYKKRVKDGRKKVDNGRSEWLEIRWNIRNEYGGEFTEAMEEVLGDIDNTGVEGWKTIEKFVIGIDKGNYERQYRRMTIDSRMCYWRASTGGSAGEAIMEELRIQDEEQRHLDEDGFYISNYSRRRSEARQAVSGSFVRAMKNLCV